MKKRKGKWKKVLVVFLCLFVVLTIRHIYNGNQVFYNISYEKQDISGTLTKLQQEEPLSQEESLLLFRQTGVSLDAAKELVRTGNKERLETLHDLYFQKPDTKKHYIAYPITVEEKNKNQQTPLVNLQKGDILVTFNTHTFDWRHGHCGLVLDAQRGLLLEHMSIGNLSCLTQARTWGDYPGFVVLRHPDKELAAKAADYANEHLIGIEYNILAGITKKDKSDEEKPSSSHCSHIVWQAYKAVGADIDQNGGMIVTPRDIAMSEQFQVVQIYGINPKKYSDRVLGIHQ